MLVTDEWKDITRIKALGLVFLGIPLYIVSSFLIMISPTYIEILPKAQLYFASLQVIDALMTIIRIIPPFVMGGILASVFMNFLFLSVLQKAGYDKNEIQDIKRYGADGSLVLTLGFAVIIIISVLYLSSGWAHPESAFTYFLGTATMIVILIAYGHLYVRCFPSALRPIYRRVLETMFVFTTIITAFSIYMTIICGSIALLLLTYFYYLSEKNLPALGAPSEFMIMRKMKVEGREIDNDVISFTFYRLHPKLSFTVAFFFIAWFLALFLYFEISFEIIIIGFAIPSVIYWSIPRIWLRRISSNDDLN
jgi:hypothetical protein